MEDNGQHRPDTLLLSDQVQHRLRRAYQRASSIFSESMAEAPGEPAVTLAQWAAMSTLCAQGAVSQNLLGRQTFMDPATIQGVILRLEERALVERSPDPQDRRRTSVKLTESGIETVRGLAPRAFEAHRQTLAPLTPAEQATFLALLARLM